VAVCGGLQRRSGGWARGGWERECLLWVVRLAEGECIVSHRIDCLVALRLASTVKSKKDPSPGGSNNADDIDGPPGTDSQKCSRYWLLFFYISNILGADFF
jgi:hypothetical protein